MWTVWTGAYYLGMYCSAGQWRQRNLLQCARSESAQSGGNLAYLAVPPPISHLHLHYSALLPQLARDPRPSPRPTTLIFSLQGSRFTRWLAALTFWDVAAWHYQQGVFGFVSPGFLTLEWRTGTASLTLRRYVCTTTDVLVHPGKSWDDLSSILHLRPRVPPICLGNEVRGDWIPSPVLALGKHGTRSSQRVASPRFMPPLHLHPSLVRNPPLSYPAHILILLVR